MTIISWIVVLAIFWDTAASMVAVWYRSPTFGHGFLILPISLYLAWQRRQRVALHMPVPSLWGLPLLAVLGFGWLFGTLADVLVVRQLALVGILEALVWTALGTRTMMDLRFPLGFLWFAVPIGEFLVPPLQDFTAVFAAKALELSGVPVLLEGRILSIPSGTWSVAAACSGLRYLIASLVVGCLYASFAYQSWGRRLGFVLASVVVPILANALRAYGIVMLGHLSDNRIATGVDHLIYGWIFFSLVMAVLFWLGSYWRQSAGEGGQPRPPEVRWSPAREGDRDRACATQSMVLAVAGGVALVALAPVSAWALLNRMQTPTALRPAAPQVSPPWVQLGEYAGNWVPHFAGTDAEVLASFTAGTQPVHLYLGYYANERQGAELINSENTILVRKQWERITEGNRHITVDGRSLRVHEMTMRSTHGQTRLAWTWYWVAGEFTSDPYYAKLLLVKARLLGGLQGAAGVAMSADCSLNCATAAAVLQDFLQHSAPLQTTLQGFSGSPTTTN